MATKLHIKIYNDISELTEETYTLTFDEMYAKFGDNEHLMAIIARAHNYANTENLNEETLVDNQIEDFEDLTPRSPLNNPSNFL